MEAHPLVRGCASAEHANPRFRASHEDAHSLDVSLPGSALFSVFDGHGGDAVALFAAARLHAAVRSALAAGQPPDAAFAAAFAAVDAAASAADIADYTGCTVVSALVTRGAPARAGDRPPTLVACANAGDARALLVLLDGPPATAEPGGGLPLGSAAPTVGAAAGAPPAQPQPRPPPLPVFAALSTDHTPSTVGESQRIAAVGGVVARGRVCGVLAVSRALGDFRLQPAVTSAPACASHTLLPEQRAVLLLFCDGVSCVMDDAAVAAFVVGCASGLDGGSGGGGGGGGGWAGAAGDADAKAIADALVQEALLRGSRDNVTAVAVLL